MLFKRTQEVSSDELWFDACTFNSCFEIGSSAKGNGKNVASKNGAAVAGKRKKRDDLAMADFSNENMKPVESSKLSNEGMQSEEENHQRFVRSSNNNKGKDVLKDNCWI